MKGKITFHMKTNKGFSLVNVLCLGKIMEIRDGKKQVTDKRTRALMRGMNHLVKQIRTFILRLDNYADEIRSGAITYEADPKKRGGDITFSIEGEEELVELFCKYRIKDKVAAMPFKPLMSISREVR